MRYGARLTKNSMLHPLTNFTTSRRFRESLISSVMASLPLYLEREVVVKLRVNITSPVHEMYLRVDSAVSSQLLESGDNRHRIPCTITGSIQSILRIKLICKHRIRYL